MNRWREQLDNHPIHGTLKELRELMEYQFSDTDGDSFKEQRRLVLWLDQLEEILGRLDAESIPFSVLHRIQQEIENNVLYLFRGSLDHISVSELQHANNVVTELMPDIASLRSLAADGVGGDKAESLNLLTDNFVNLLAEKSSGIDESLDGIARRQSELELQQESLKQDISAVTANLQQEANTEKISFSETLQELLDDAKAEHQEILRLHEIVAVDSTTAGYEKSANDERKAANTWRWMSIGSVALTAVWLFCVVLYAHFGRDEPLAWSSYPLILSLTVVLMFGAVYCGQQSTNHRRNEQRNRWLALRVAAFEPFVRPLQEDQQNAIRQELSSSLFGSDSMETPNQKDSIKMFNVVFDGIEKMLKALSR